MARLQAIHLLCTAVLLGILCHTATALPALSWPFASKKSSSITSLTTSQVSAYTPYSYYAAAGYCDPSTTFTWTCGTNCKANPSFIPVSSGGDGSLTQYWYVGYDPTLNEVIVAHQGTYSSNILNLLEDGTIVQRSLNSDLFPGVSSSIKVHSGFADSQERSSNDVKTGVLAALAKHKTTKVTVVGHSLGAAIALLDAVYLPLQISGITTRFIGYGLPRIGNQAFADYIDSLSAKLSVTHINHEEDVVPILPGRGLGFHHPSGEIHIQDSGAWVSCPGQDNTSSQCSTGDVWSILVGKISDHKGPYGSVVMAADTCA